MASRIGLASLYYYINQPIILYHLLQFITTFFWLSSCVCKSSLTWTVLWCW